MIIFIDTNVFLGFYHLTSEDLEELRKLSALIQNGQVELVIPSQVIDEFVRNRESKIQQAMKTLAKQKASKHFPNVCADYQDYKDMRVLLNQYEQKHKNLMDNLARDASDRKLKADALIEDLFSRAKVVQVTPTILSAAQERACRGNPPGKPGSFGDAINWEVLLDHITIGKDIIMVSEDGDYRSPLDEGRLHDFLEREWTTKKHSKATYYRRLSSFFRDKFPEIKLAADITDELIVRQFCGSPNYATTHRAISRLDTIAELTDTHVNEIAFAALNNSQITRIITDDDVNEYLVSLVRNYGHVLRPGLKKSLEAALNPAEPPVVELTDEEVPF